MKIFFILVIIFVTNCSWFARRDSQDSKNQESVVATFNTVDLSKRVTVDPCAKAFEETLTQLNSGTSFKPLFDFYKNHSSCMDGAYSQGIEGAISESLESKWTQLPELNDPFTTDTKFKSFFFENIGSYVSATEKQLEAALNKSKTSCPNNLKPLCSEIKAAAEKALAHSKSQ